MRVCGVGELLTILCQPNVIFMERMKYCSKFLGKHLSVMQSNVTAPQSTASKMTIRLNQNLL